MTGNHLIDSPIKLAQCPRCQQYVFLAMSSGVRSAADLLPLDKAGYIEALVAGRRLFRVIETAGRPVKLPTVPTAQLDPSFDTSGAQTGAPRIHTEHGCGSHALDAVAFEEIPEGPPPAPATSGERRGGIHPPPVPDSTAPASSPARPATPARTEAVAEAAQTAVEALGAPLPPPTRRRRSESSHHSETRPLCPSPTEPAAKPGQVTAAPTAQAATKPSVPTVSPTSIASGNSVSTGAAPTPPPSVSSSARTAYGEGRRRSTPSTDLGPVRCHTCRRLIDLDTPHIGIHHGRWVWAVHEECA